MAYVTNKNNEDYMDYLSNKTPMLPALGFNKVIEKHMSKRNKHYNFKTTKTDCDSMSKTISVFN